MSKFQFSPKQKESIRDALEMRVKECNDHVQNMKALKTPVGDHLALTFQNTADKAEATLAAIDRAEAEGQW